MHRPALLKNPVIPVALTVALVGSVAATVAFSATGKQATLLVDGAPRSVDFRGHTVNDVLDAADLTVGPHDSLVPARGESIQDGDRVAVRRGRQVELVVDGIKRTVWVTAGSVDEALDQVGLRESGLALSASRSRSIPLDGLALQVTTPKDILISLDGKTTKVRSAATSVRAALIERGVVLDANDRLTPGRTAPLSEGLSIKAVRVRRERTDDTQPLPFATQRRDDGDLTIGTTKVLQAGQPGEVRQTTESVLADGKVESSTVIARVVTTTPVAQVLAVGTKPQAAEWAALRRSSGDAGAGAPSSAGGLNWAALARCESGGNPSAVSSSGAYRGLYQFSFGTWAGVGGSGDPASASPAEQTSRAQILYSRSGRSPWPVCGRNL